MKKNASPRRMDAQLHVDMQLTAVTQLSAVARNQGHEAWGGRRQTDKAEGEPNRRGSIRASSLYSFNQLACCEVKILDRATRFKAHHFAKMSSGQDGAEINQATAKTKGDERIWDRAEPGKHTDEFREWIGLPTTTDDASEATESTTRPRPTARCPDLWEVFVPKVGHCGVWEKSSNKERHVSFGDSGTTASANCVGDLIQISQYLAVGHSGVFTIDQCSTEEP